MHKKEVRLKFLLIILILTTNQSKGQAKILFSDNNGVTVSYKLFNTGQTTQCYVDYDKNFTNTTIDIWELTATITNKSKTAIKPKLSTTISMNVGVLNGIDSHKYCQYQTIRGYYKTDGYSEQNKPFFGITSVSRWLSTGRSFSKTTYFYLYKGEIPQIFKWDFPGYHIKPKKEKEKKDDFWNGKKEKSSNDTSNNDDYWKGGTDNTKKKTNTFWSGKGNTQEEMNFKENTKANNSDVFIGNVRSRTNRIRIFCIDTGLEDGDKVQIRINGEVVESSIYLTNAGEYYSFNLKFGQNTIEIKALNQGSTGANTAAFEVYDDKGVKLAQKGWHLQTGYKGKLLILKI
jgi:hypothetical protein